MSRQEEDGKISQSEYWREVARIAKDVKKDTKERGSSRAAWRERAQDRLHQEVDGHQWIIYTWAYPWILIHSTNHEAYFENYGKLEGEEYSSTMQKMAFAAMLQDVEEALGMLFDPK